MRKIAVLYLHSFYDYDGCLQDAVIKHITNWTELEDDDFVKLRAGISVLNEKKQYHDGQYVLIEQVQDKEFISDTIDGYLKYIEEQKAKKEAAKLKKEALAAQKKAKRKEELLKQLKELEGDK